MAKPHPPLLESVRPTPVFDQKARLRFLEALEEISWPDGRWSPLCKLRLDVWPAFMSMWVQDASGYPRFAVEGCNPLSFASLSEPDAARNPFVAATLEAITEWAAEFRLNDDWILDTAVRTLNSGIPRSAPRSDEWRSGSLVTTWQYRFIQPTLLIELDPWDASEEWGEFYRRARNVFEGRLAWHREAVVDAYANAKAGKEGGTRRWGSTRHAQWTASVFAGYSFADLASSARRTPNRQTVRQAVLQFAKRIGLTLPNGDN